MNAAPGLRVMSAKIAFEQPHLPHQGERMRAGRPVSLDYAHSNSYSMHMGGWSDAQHEPVPAG